MLLKNEDARKMEGSSKTIETLEVLKYFPGLNNRDGLIIDPWENPANIHYCPDEKDPILRIIEVERWPHHLRRVADIPKQVTNGNLVIIYYSGYNGFAEDLAAFLKEKNIDTEIRPYKE